MGTLGESDAELVPIYDYSEWPVFVVRMPPRALSPEAFAEHLVECAAPYLRNQPFGMLIDMGVHPPLPAIQRKAVSEAMTRANQLHPGLHQALAIVVGSPFARGIVTAISWVARPPYPFTAFESVPEAKTWILEQLRRARIEPPKKISRR